MIPYSQAARPSLPARHAAYRVRRQALPAALSAQVRRSRARAAGRAG
jgi:hypothetical protein